MDNPKNRVVVDRHLTDTPMHIVYSRVVLLQGFQMVLFLAELKEMKPYTTKIEISY